jgi:hypothetical protein
MGKTKNQQLEESEEEIFSLIRAGEMLSAIADKFKVDRTTFFEWLDADKERSVRAREARAKASSAWDEKAERGIANATDAFELAKAKELAHHYRWRASKIAPKLYGDKVQTEVTGVDGGPLQITVQYVSPKKVEE